MYRTCLDDIEEERVSHNPAVRKRVIIDGSVIPRLNQFSEARFPPGECAPAHHHDDLYEVFFVDAGEGIMEVDAATIPLTPGTCVTVAPGESHSITNTGPDTLLLRYFSIHY